MYVPLSARHVCVFGCWEPHKPFVIPVCNHLDTECFKLKVPCSGQMPIPPRAESGVLGRSVVALLGTRSGVYYHLRVQIHYITIYIPTDPQLQVWIDFAPSLHYTHFCYVRTQTLFPYRCRDVHLGSVCTWIQRSTYYNFEKQLKNIYTEYKHRRRRIMLALVFDAHVKYICTYVLIVEDTGAAGDQLPVEAR